MAMRKSYAADFKARVVLELLKEEKTMAELASEHGVHATMLHRWRKAAVEALPEVFREGAKEAARQREHEDQVDQLYREIGRLTTQLEWIKKKSGIHLE